MLGKLKTKVPSWIVDGAIVGLFFLIAYFIQTRAIGKMAYPSTDEGVYLYSSKLIAQGFTPYKDFFLTHMPFLMYLNAGLLELVKFNMNAYHFVYTFWTLSAILPIYFIVKKIGQSRLAGVLSVLLFATFVEMVGWDMHFFAIRQASLPFLAWGIFFLDFKKNLSLAALFLALFAICLSTNIILASGLILSYLVFDFIFNRKDFDFKKLIWPAVIFIGIIGSQIALLAHTANGLNDVIWFQVNRSPVDLQTRILIIKGVLPKNWPIIAFGLGGIFALRKSSIYLSVFNLLAILTVLFVGNSFLGHYITILAVGFAISAGILFGALFRLGKIVRWAILFFVLIGIFVSSYQFLRLELLSKKKPVFFEVVNALEQAPEPILSNEPIYALYAGKDLTFHYDVADMRHFDIAGGGLPEKKWLELAEKSQTVFIEPRLVGVLPQSARDYISQNFSSTYDNGNESVWVRN